MVDEGHAVSFTRTFSRDIVRRGISYTQSVIVTFLRRNYKDAARFLSKIEFVALDDIDKMRRDGDIIVDWWAGSRLVL